MKPTNPRQHWLRETVQPVANRELLYVTEDVPNLQDAPELLPILAEHIRVYLDTRKALPVLPAEANQLVREFAQARIGQ